MLLAAVLFAAGAVGGAVNAVAGGGSFLVFPSLLLLGVPPVAANATTAAALWPAGIASTIAYRRDLTMERKPLVVLAVASLLGGAIGAVLLLKTSDRTFIKILPLLMLGASAVFTLGPRLVPARNGKHLPLVLGALVQLLIASYGGYFGGGMGILMLATFTLMGMAHLNTMNGLKTLLSVVINGVATVAFFSAHEVLVTVALPVAVGSIVGGFGAAALARKVDPKAVRTFALVFAWGLTAWSFAKAFAT